MTFSSFFRPASRVFLALAPFALCAACETYDLDPPAAELIKADENNVVDPREIVVLVNSKSAASNLVVKARGRGYRIKAETNLSSLDLIMMELEIPRGRDGVSAIRELENLEPSATAGVNHAYTLQATEQSLASLDYGPDLVGWPTGPCQSTVRIGVIDGTPSMRSDSRVTVHNVTGQKMSSAGHHADAVVSILMKNRFLVDPEIFVAGVVETLANGQPAAGTDSILQAVDWLSQKGVTLVNVSLAGPYNKILDRGLQRAIDKGMVFVAAVGNAGPTASPQYPAAFDDVIAVTAVDADGMLYKHAVRGQHIDIAAPGVDILVNLADGERFMSGTSLSVPFVTARLAASPKTKTADRIRNARFSLHQTVRPTGRENDGRAHGLGILHLGGRCPS